MANRTFDGAILFGADFLTRLAASAAPGSFRPDLFRLDPMEPEGLAGLMVIQNSLTPEELATRSGGAAAFRVTRIGGFWP